MIEEKINLDSVFLMLDKEIYIDELIMFLENRKSNYTKIKPILGSAFGETTHIILEVK